MVLTYHTASAVTVQTPPIVAELQAVFDSLDDSPLLAAPEGPMRRGPKGHAVQVLWRCFIAKYVLACPTTRAMIRTLHNNPFVAQVCGIDSPDDIPHEATFSRFFKRLAARKYLHKVKDVSRRLSLAYQAATPGFAQRVAIDSTTLKGWVNGGKPNPSDKMARWSVKKNTHGKTEFVLGWKLHLMVDCETEFPIAASISPGNTSDVTRASFLLAEARENVARFYPRYVMADAGYSSKDLFALIKRQYRAEPIIQVNRGHKRLMVRYGYWENTVSWKALYSQRQAVERCFSRLKGQRSLNNITVRGSTKVKAHCYLSLIAMQAGYLSAHVAVDSAQG